jgi:hypothetical protein
MGTALRARRLGRTGGRWPAAPFLEARGLAGRPRWLSLPFTDHCPPFAPDRPAADALLTAFSDAHAALGGPVLELRASAARLEWRSKAGAVTHLLDIDPDPATVQPRFSRSRHPQHPAGGARGRGRSHRLRRAGLGRLQRAARTNTPAAGVPVQPRKFFDLIWSRLVGPRPRLDPARLHVRATAGRRPV